MRKEIIKVNMFFLIFLLALAVSSVNCSKENESVSEKKKDTIKTSTTTTTTESAVSPGKELFYMKSSANNIACADCHGDGTNSSNLLTKYFSDIRGAGNRVSTYHGKFKGEDVINNAGGATVCWESYLKMKTPLTEEQIKSLNEYYKSVSTPDSQKEIVYETIALPDKNKAKLKEVQKVVSGLNADPVKGEEKFKNACGFCHGDKSTVKKIPDIFDEFEGNVKSIVYNVRLGDSAMPFFNEGKLSNQDLADIAAYIMKRNGQ